MSNNNYLGLYIHVPFCEKKCPYCNFYSVQNSEELQNKYINIIIQELQKFGANTNKIIDTIYFGGGTPSLLKPEKIYKIINNINKNFSILNPEITIEINPADYNYSDFEILKSIGINRVSVGAQSLNNNNLITLQRRHNTEHILNTYYNIIKSGIKNISFDFIIGLLGQNFQDLDNIINFCKNNYLAHISVYLLKIEKNTKFFDNQNIKNFADQDICSDFYIYISENLKKIGYDHYEISNFARDNMYSKHNLKYWNLDEYLGIGPSAHSFFNNKRFYYKNNLNNFLENPEIIYDSDSCNTPDEYIMLKLRLKSGVSNQEFQKKFNMNIPDKYFSNLKKYENLGLVNYNKNKISLTNCGFLLSNTIISDIIL